MLYPPYNQAVLYDGGGGYDSPRFRVLRHLAALKGGAAPAVPAFVEGLKSDNEDLRSDSAQALGDIGPIASPAIPELIEALKDESHYVRQKAQGALDKIRKGP